MPAPFTIPLARLGAAMLLLCAALAGCGGGGSGTAPAPSEQGSRVLLNVSSTHTRAAYAVSVYLPPSSAGDPASLPIVYALDGQSWFNPLVDLAQTSREGMIVVALDGSRRNQDYVPVNQCTPDGGGNEAFFAFIRQELIPKMESEYGGDPGKRVLFGHSHGGAFVLYAMFSEAPGSHTFSTYLASDASVSCMSATARGWNQAYAAAHKELPVKLHLSYATLGNFAANAEYADQIARPAYERFTFVAQSYVGTHGGIVPAALADGTAFAFR